jgi:WhiB family redox-sensing transcriptional regulator
MAGHDLEHHIPPAGPPSGLAGGPMLHRQPAARAAVLDTVRAVSPGWMSRGACRGEDPELFFPIAAAGPALAQIRAAKAVCGRCPVQPDCLSYALVTGQADGIWGGTTRDERRPALRLRSGPPARLR